MPTVEILTQKEKELIAVAASVASGCIPCTLHHTKVVRDSGASEAEVLSAIRIALDVRDYATEMMAELAHGNLNYAYPARTQSGSLKRPIDDLIAMGAALACNSVAGLEYYWTKARAAGASTRQIQIAMGIARAIRKEAEEIMDTVFGRLLKPSQEQPNVTLNIEEQKKCFSPKCCCS